MVHNLLDKYHGALLMHHFLSIHRRPKLDAATLDRLLAQEAAKLSACRGAWMLALPSG